MRVKENFGVLIGVPPPTGDFLVQLRRSVLDWHLLLPNQATGIRRSINSADQLQPAGMMSGPSDLGVGWHYRDAAGTVFGLVHRHSGRVLRKAGQPR